MSTFKKNGNISFGLLYMDFHVKSFCIFKPDLLNNPNPLYMYRCVFFQFSVTHVEYILVRKLSISVFSKKIFIG